MIRRGGPARLTAVSAVIGEGATFAAMMPWMFRLFTVYFTAVVAAPGILFVQYQAHRSYIERELCVQRDVMEGMRTCHGECFLSKRYKVLEQEAEKGFPVERMVRHEPVVQVVQAHHVCVLPVVTIRWSDPGHRLSDGFGGPVDHVPRG